MEKKRKIKTDEYYTPPKVYEAVKNWVCAEYGIEESKIVRPFWPGGDYERFEYPEECVVVDNPPFSILSQIRAFYSRRKIRFFLFSPGNMLTGIAKDQSVSYIICDTHIEYQNGEIVKTNFITNLSGGGGIAAETKPDLDRAIETAVNADKADSRENKLPKYIYPNNVITAAQMQKLAGYGVKLKIRRDECTFVRRLDAQTDLGKNIFGGGLLLSERAAAERAAAERAAAERAAAERAAAERAAAERAAAERAAAIRWKLSERELEIVRRLGTNRETEGEINERDGDSGAPL